MNDNTIADLFMSPTQAERLVMVGKKEAGRVKHKTTFKGREATVPNGYNLLSDAVRAGIKLERDEGMTAVTVAKKVGLGRQCYRYGRDAVLLADRSDLSPEDEAAAKEALKTFDETKQFNRIRGVIRPLVEKIWGTGSGSRFTAERKRMDAFDNAVSFTLTTCTTLVEITIPHLSMGDRREALSQIQEASAALKQFQKRLGGR